MIEELRKMVQDRLVEVSGLRGLVITDMDGVPVLQVSQETPPSGGVGATEACQRFQFTSAHSIAEEKCGRLAMINCKRSLVHYQDQQVLTTVVNGSTGSADRLVLSLIADAEANTGILENFAKRMQPLVSDIAKAVIVNQVPSS